MLLAEKDAALAALAQRIAALEVGQGARAQLDALDAQSSRLRVRAAAIQPIRIVLGCTAACT